MQGKLMISFVMMMVGYAEILAVVIQPYVDAQMGIEINQMNEASLGLFFLGIVTVYFGTIFMGGILEQMNQRDRERVKELSYESSMDD